MVVLSLEKEREMEEQRKNKKKQREKIFKRKGKKIDPLMLGVL